MNLVKYRVRHDSPAHWLEHPTVVRKDRGFVSVYYAYVTLVSPAYMTELIIYYLFVNTNNKNKV